MIFALGTDVNGGENVFLNVMSIDDIGKRAHVIRNSHGRCVVGSFDKNLHKCSIWTVHRSVLSFILQKTIFLHFVQHGTKFYDRYIKSDNRTKYVYDDGSGVKPKQKVRMNYSS